MRRVTAGMVGFVGLTLEIAYTRIVSFKLFYYYTYFVIGLALLGFGAAATVTALSDRLRRREVLDTRADPGARGGAARRAVVPAGRAHSDRRQRDLDVGVARAGRVRVPRRDRGRAGADRRVLRARAGDLAADRRRLGGRAAPLLLGSRRGRRSAACSQCRSSARSARRRWCCCRWSPSPASGWRSRSAAVTAPSWRGPGWR